jgi:hypothetical protein
MIVTIGVNKGLTGLMKTVNVDSVEEAVLSLTFHCQYMQVQSYLSR